MHLSTRKICRVTHRRHQSRPNMVRLAATESRPQAIRSFALIIILVSMLPALLSAQEMEIPVATQLQLFSKVLSFERTMQSVKSNEFVLGVLVLKNVRLSTQVRDDIKRTIERTSLTINGRPVRMQTVEFTDEAALQEVLNAHTLHALYVTPMRSVAIDAIARRCTEAKVMTLTGVPNYAYQGIVVGIGLRGDKQQLLLNISSAKSIGADFSAKLLSLATIVSHDSR